MGDELQTVRVGSAALIYDSGGRFLIGRRSSKLVNGIWVFPGGGIEFGESSRKAVVREVKEETGILIKPIRLLKVYEMILKKKGFHRVIFFYIARKAGGSEKPSTDMAELRWLKPKDITKLKNLGETVLPILKEATKNLEL